MHTHTHTLLAFHCFLFSFALGTPLFVNNNAYQSEGHGDDNTISIQGGSRQGYVYGKNELSFGPSYEDHEQAPIVQKHIYVHVPPPENDYFAPQKVIPPPPPKIHYKIVFIKMPSPPTPEAPVLPPPQQDQEKTLIYVLHKHPVETPPIVIPSPKPTPPVKPEVYFIRYKTQKQLVSTPSPYESISTLQPYDSRKKLPHVHLGSTPVSIIPHASSTFSPTESYN